MIEVTSEVKTKFKCAALGCYYDEVWHQGQMIGTVGYNGVCLFDKNYQMTEEKSLNGVNVVRVFQIDRIEPQVPIE